jgi:hypothetical protein
MVDCQRDWAPDSEDCVRNDSRISRFRPGLQNLRQRRDYESQILPLDSHETTMSSSSQEGPMIEGLMLTIPGEELRRLLEQ